MFSICICFQHLGNPREDKKRYFESTPARLYFFIPGIYFVFITYSLSKTYRTLNMIKKRCSSEQIRVELSTLLFVNCVMSLCNEIRMRKKQKQKMNTLLQANKKTKK
ncbi:unnamed protein product [Ixodes pacificus]